MENAGGDSAETSLSRYAKYEGVVDFHRRPIQQHQGILVQAPCDNPHRILLPGGFLGWLQDREEFSTEKIPTDLTDLIESSASRERICFLLLPS